MTKAHAEVVPATVTDVADVERWSAETVVTLRLIRAVVAGCADAPSLNAWFNGEERSRQLRTTIDFGIAVDIEDGLFVPVLHDVGHRAAEDRQDGLERLKWDVRMRTIPPAELRGQIITLSNFGTVGGQHAQLVVVPPQVAIVGVGRLTRQVIAEGDSSPVTAVADLRPLGRYRRRGRGFLLGRDRGPGESGLTVMAQHPVRPCPRLGITELLPCRRHVGGIP